MAGTTPRAKLSLRLAASQGDRIATASALIKQSLDQDLCLRWSYNRTVMRVAPQILYTDNGEIFVDAIAIEKNGEAPDELKLGRFKLSGLSGIAITTEPFAPTESIDLGSVRYQEAVLARAGP